MRLHTLLLVSLFTRLIAGFSMSMRDVGITDDIHWVASSLNDIFKEAFELMIGSLGKHGVYYLPEIKHVYDYQHKPVQFQASNGWMKYPLLRSAEEIRSGALRKYKVPTGSAKEVLLVCVECLVVSAEAVNFCYEAAYGGKNVSGTITSGPIVYRLSVELRVAQSAETCNVTLGQRSLELDSHSKLHAEVRGLRTFNFLADNIDSWLQDHLNGTVRDRLDLSLLTALHKVLAKHDTCTEFITK